MSNHKDSSSRVSAHKEVVNVLCDTALNNDWIEARNAEQRAARDECGQLNKWAYLDRIESIKQDLSSAREHFNTQIDRYVAKGDKCEHLDDVSEEWERISGWIAGLKSRIESAGVEWQGRAASLYRANQRTQLKAVEELEGIVAASSVAVSNISTIQESIYSLESSQYEITKSRLVREANRRVNNYKRSNFYSRSKACAVLVSAMADRLQDVANGSGWAGTASSVASEIRETKEAPAVIDEAKGWPEIGDYVAEEASDTNLVGERAKRAIAVARTQVDSAETGVDMTTTKDVVDGVIGVFSSGG